MSVVIFGGGTRFHVASHFALDSPALGGVARQFNRRLTQRNLICNMVLTRMADRHSRIDTNDQVETELRRVLDQHGTRAIVFSAALCDVVAKLPNQAASKYAPRIQTREIPPEGLTLQLFPAPKLLPLVKRLRPDVKLVGFKASAGATAEQQALLAQRQILETGAEVVLANDTVTHTNIVVERLRPSDPFIVTRMPRPNAIDHICQWLDESIIRSFLEPRSTAAVA